MRYGSGKLNVSHTLTANLGFCDLNAAAVAYNALVTDSLILSAMALPVLGRSENSLAEETVLFRFKGTIIYSFGLGYLAVRPFSDLFRRSKTDFN